MEYQSGFRFRCRFKFGRERVEQFPESVVADVAGDASDLAAVIHHHEGGRVANRRGKNDAGRGLLVDIDTVQWKHLGFSGLAINRPDIAIPSRTPDAAVTL